MPASIKYTTKIIGISEVVMNGRLKFNEGDWVVKTNSSQDRLEEWLGKFDGQYVTITIKNWVEDEAHLLPEEEDAKAKE